MFKFTSGYVFDFRFRRKKKARAAMTAISTIATPTPIPAFAPLERPLLGEDVGVGVLLVFGSPVPVSLDVGEELALVDISLVVGDGTRKPTVVGVALAVNTTWILGLFAP